MSLRIGHDADITTFRVEIVRASGTVYYNGSAFRRIHKSETSHAYYAHPGSHFRVHDELQVQEGTVTGEITEYRGHVGDAAIDGSGFAGNLATTIDTVQKLADAVDDLTLGSGGGGVDVSDDTPESPTASGTSGTSDDASRSDHQHPAELPDDTVTPGMLVADSAAQRNAMRARIGAGTSSVSTFSGLGGTLADSQIPAEIARDSEIPDTAAEIGVDATGFAGNLATTDDDVQTALETIDALSLGGGGAGTDDQTAAEVPVTATGFTGNLSSADDDVQAALETIDALAVSSGAAGHTPRVNSGTAFPTTPAPLSPDMFIFSDDVASGLDWLDTDGSTALTAADNGDLARYNGTAWVKVINLIGAAGASGEAYQRVDSLVFTAVASTTTQDVQQTLAATGFLVEDYESGGESPVTAVASATTFTMKAGVYIIEWAAIVTNSGQRAAPTLDVQDDADDSVIGSVEFHYIRYANTAVRYTFTGLLVVAADDTVCKAIVYNKTEDEAFTVSAGHTLRIASLAGGGATGAQQSGAFSISDVEVISALTATTEYGLGTTWLSVIDAISPTFTPIDPDDILWISIGLRVDTEAAPRILIMGSDIRQIDHVTDPLPTGLSSSSEVPGVYYSARVPQTNEDRTIEINPTLSWMEARRMAARYGVLFSFSENAAGNITQIRPWVSANTEIDIEYITITVKGT